MQIDNVRAAIEPHEICGTVFHLEIGNGERKLSIHAVLPKDVRQFDHIQIADALRAIACELEEMK